MHDPPRAQYVYLMSAKSGLMTNRLAAIDSGLRFLSSKKEMKPLSKKESERNSRSRRFCLTDSVSNQILSADVGPIVASEGQLEVYSELEFSLLVLMSDITELCADSWSRFL